MDRFDLGSFMTTFEIPAAYQELSQNKAAFLTGIPRTTFKRKYWDTGKLTISKDIEGNDFVSFNELYRVFGENITQNLKTFLYGQDGHTSAHVQDIDHGKDGQYETDSLDNKNNPFLSLKIENERLKAERSGMEALLNEFRDQLERERARLTQAENRATVAESQVRGFLEDSSRKSLDWQRITELEQKIDKMHSNKSFLDRLKSFFST